MSLFVNVPTDIEEYEERIFAGLTARQAKWSGVAMGVGLSFYIASFVLLHLNQDIAIYGTAAVAIGFFACGWGTWEGRPVTDLFKAGYRYYMTSQTVFYRSEARYFEGGIKRNVWKKYKDRKINRSECYERKRESKKEKKSKG
ncbi:MAG: PrgI family protein [Firmicutes bacterium]|nr:PrgI family protein [Bacillota bacterium]